MCNKGSNGKATIRKLLRHYITELSVSGFSLFGEAQFDTLQLHSVNVALVDSDGLFLVFGLGYPQVVPPQNRGSVLCHTRNLRRGEVKERATHVTQF